MAPKVEFKCAIPGVKEIYPIRPISHFRPHWLDAETHDYVAARKEYQENPWGIIQKGMSIAKCVGVRKLYTTGWVVTTWQDIIIDYDTNTGQLNWRSAIDQTTKNKNLGPAVAFHSPDTFKHCPHLAQHPHILKLENPWVARIPEGYNMLQMPFPYQEHDMFQAAVGIFPGENGLMQLNAQLIWKAKGATMLPAGTPLAHIMLVKNEDYEYEVTDITSKEETVWGAQTNILHSSWEKNYAGIRAATKLTMDQLDGQD